MKIKINLEARNEASKLCGTLVGDVEVDDADLERFVAVAFEVGAPAFRKLLTAIVTAGGGIPQVHGSATFQAEELRRAAERSVELTKFMLYKLGQEGVK